MKKSSSNDILYLLASNLKYFRTKKGLSQEKLAELANLDRTYISLLETAKRNPSLVCLNELARVLDIKVVDLLAENNKI